MKAIYLIILTLLSSCSTLNNITLSKNIKNESKKICVNSDGNGRLTVLDKTYSFSYESILEADNHHWNLALDFPFRPQENFSIDWANNGKFKYQSSLDQKILRENKNINAKDLDLFILSVGNFLKDLVQLRSKENPRLKYKWKIFKKKITAHALKKRAKLNFSNIDAKGYFGKMSVLYESESKKTFKMEFIVSKCFEKFESI